jgi:hypothetical protein
MSPLFSFVIAPAASGWQGNEWDSVSPEESILIVTALRLMSRFFALSFGMLEDFCALIFF